MRLQRVIERNYTDRADISRMEESETEKGETKLTPVPLYTQIPCRISQRALATNSQSESFNEIAYETKMFLSPAIIIRQGDRIAVTRGHTTRTYTAGEPFLYLTHQEVSLNRLEKA